MLGSRRGRAAHELERQMSYKVLVTDVFSCEETAYPDLDLVVEPTLWKTPEALALALADADAWIVRNMTKVTSDLLSAASNLKVVGRLGVGLDNVDLEAAKAAGVMVVYTPQANALSVAEYCLGQLLNLFRGLVRADVSTRGGGWERTAFVGREVAGSTIGIIGYGNSGAAFANICSALGAHVLVHTPRPESVSAPHQAVDLDELLAASDAVSLHVPLTDKTNGFVDAVFLDAMKPGAVLINAARGEVLQEPALIAALNSGHLAGAALDVRGEEPPVIGSVETLPQTILSPHVAAFTKEAQARVTETVMNDVLAVLNARQPACPAF